MGDLGKAQKKHAAARGWLTRAVNQLKDITKSATVKIEQALEFYNTHMEKVNEAQEEVELFINNDNLAAEIEEAGKIDDKARKAKLAAMLKAKELEKAAKKTDDDEESVSSASSRNRAHVRLQKSNYQSLVVM